ncbi:MAG: excinuclease ABC subunit UvrA, partial [Planctomycetes bacterium]|nr:excinuclease ABC subunit UvrA [Planctomycetota bacterium]
MIDSVRSCRPEDNQIVILGAKEHNLQNINVRIPRDRLVVVTGLSGSGKSSLAFDTIYAEGQRKYVESLSAYARQFLAQLQKPDVEHIEGLPPTIAIEQRAGSANPRSTVATTTEIYDYLRLLFARVGQPHCWICDRPITSQTVTNMVDSIFRLPEGTRFMVLAPLVRGQKGQHEDVFRLVQREGFVRVRMDGVIYDVKGTPELKKNVKHTIEVVVDRLVLRETVRPRLADSLEVALRLSDGLVVICYQEDEAPARRGKPAKADEASEPAVQAKGQTAWRDQIYSATYACPDHPEVNLPELAPRMFSFNSPYGACPECDGLGTILEFDPDLIVPDPTLTLSHGAIAAWRHGGQRMNIYYSRLLRQFCRDNNASPNVPYAQLPAAIRQSLMSGSGRFEGVVPNLTRRWQNTDSEYVKEHLHAYLSENPCRACKGTRLRPASLAVRIGQYNVHDVTSLS